MRECFSPPPPRPPLPYAFFPLLLHIKSHFSSTWSSDKSEEHKWAAELEEEENFADNERVFERGTLVLSATCLLYPCFCCMTMANWGYTIVSTQTHTKILVWSCAIEMLKKWLQRWRNNKIGQSLMWRQRTNTDDQDNKSEIVSTFCRKSS